MKKYLASIMIAFLVSCGTSTKEETPKESSEKDNSTEKVIQAEKEEELAKKKQEEKKLEKLRYYMNNSSVTDENGIRYNLSIKSNIVSKNALYRSEKIHYEYRYDKFDIVVNSYEINTVFKLYANGELKDKVELKGFLLESKRSDTDDVFAYCNDSYTYYPKIENKDIRKRKVSKFTGANCGLGKEINNKVINARIKAVKACNF